jgi:hypothetical protein
VKNKSFFFEIKDIMTQFVAAFDDCVISRYNKNRVEQEQIEVRYVFKPKERVIYDIVNKAQNLTLPVVAVNITSISRDPSRVFNKLEPTYLPLAYPGGNLKSSKLLQPVPVNITVSFSILTKYLLDMDQILSNFIPYSDPYIILSWLVPTELGLPNTEIRTEVLWSGDISLTTPIETTYSDQFQVAADTTFTIKAWLFKQEQEPEGIIYRINNNFHTVGTGQIFNLIDPYKVLSSYETTDVVTVSGSPGITNLFYTLSGTTVPVTTPITIQRDRDNQFIIWGKNFEYSTSFYLSSNKPNFFSNYTQLSTFYNPLISAYNVDNYTSILNSNIATIYMPMSTLSATGDIVIVAANDVGWAATSNGYVVTVD